MVIANHDHDMEPRESTLSEIAYYAKAITFSAAMIAAIILIARAIAALGQ